MTFEELEKIEVAATPGPWTHVHDDDSHSMNMHVVTYGGWYPDSEDDLSDGQVVCGTLVQMPTRIGHPVSNGRWCADAEFISAARNAMSSLLAIAKAAKQAMRNGDDQGERFVLYRGDASALANALTAFEKNA